LSSMTACAIWSCTIFQIDGWLFRDQRCELTRNKTVNPVNGKLLSDAQRQSVERTRYLLTKPMIFLHCIVSSYSAGLIVVTFLSWYLCNTMLGPPTIFSFNKRCKSLFLLSGMVK
jgi:hypothetical protein